MGLSWLLAQKRLIIFAGLVSGVLGAMLVEWGNPANMGICAACFLRDTAGAVGLHRAGPVQYLRPEIFGFILGAFLSAFAFREFRARGGSSPAVRFLLGAFVMIGALVFLGCPIRALLRLAGGDLNGITALGGIVFGVLLGIFFLKRGFNMGRAQKLGHFAGWIMPAIILGFLLLAVFEPSFIFESETGPGSLHPALWISIAAGLGVGLMAQRTRMCFVGGWRDLFLTRDTYLFSGIAAFFIGAIVANAILGSIDWGFEGQPAAHDDHLWNFLSMTLVGLAATLLGGCPFRQMIMSGEGDNDAAVTVLGLLVGAAFAHNFLLSSSGAGPSDNGPIAVIVGLAFCIGVGSLIRQKA